MLGMKSLCPGASISVINLVFVSNRVKPTSIVMPLLMKNSEISVTSLGAVKSEHLDISALSTFRMQIFVRACCLFHWHLKRSKPLWRIWTFVPIMTPSLLIVKGDIYAQIVEQDETFPKIPKLQWLGGWSLKYAPKCFKIVVKNSEENFPFSPFACPWLMLSRKFSYSKKPGRRPTTAAKR